MANATIETTFPAAIDSGKINGAILCASDAKGNLIYSKVLGERTLLSGEKQAHQLDDVLYLASATKLMATIAAMSCVEDGLLTLTGDLYSIAPELASKQVLTGFDEADGTPTLEAQKRPITLEMLLTHSSGLAYHFMDPNIARWREKTTPKGQNPAIVEKKTVEELIDYPLIFQPGEGWMYGVGLDWAGRIVERVTGKTLLEHLQDRVFSRLGIKDAQFYPVTRPDLRERLVDLNPGDPEGLGLAVAGSPVNSLTKGDFGGHGLFMTAPDYMKVLQSLLANDGKILKPATVEDIFTHHLSPAATESHKQALGSPAGVFFRVGVEPGTKVGHGLGGLLTLEDVDGWYGDHTLTWGGGMTFTWFVDRKNDLCGVGAIMSKVEIDIPFVSELKQTFRHDVYRKRQQQVDQ